MNEYIERKAVFDKLAVIYDLARTNQRAVITDALREVSHIPAADVQPIIYAHRTINVGRRSYCSNCGKLAIMEDFCSKCGAKVKDSE